MIKSKNTRLSNEAMVNVSPAPTQISPVQFLQLHGTNNITVKYGDDLRLFCAANGWPKPTIKWTFGTQPFYKTKTQLHSIFLFPATKTLSNSTTLLLRNLTFAHNGTYICSARNSAGYITQVSQPKYEINMIKLYHMSIPRLNEIPQKCRIKKRFLFQNIEDSALFISRKS